jgi:hypothetical protein
MGCRVMAQSDEILLCSITWSLVVRSRHVRQSAAQADAVFVSSASGAVMMH